MRRLIVITILIITTLPVMAQDNLDLPVWSNFPVINLTDYLADGISIEKINYLPIYIADDEQQVIHYLDYDAMEWKYIDYPENETKASARENLEGGFTLRSGDYQYNLEIQEWEQIDHSNENTYDPSAPDEYCGRAPDLRESDVWNWEDIESTEELSEITFCNAVTDEYYTMTTLEAGEVCEMSEADYFSRYTNEDGNLFALFDGILENSMTRICLYDVASREYKVIGDIETTFDKIEREYIQDNKILLVGVKHLDSDIYGIPRTSFWGNVVDLFEVNLNSNDGINRITPDTTSETIILSGGTYFTNISGTERAFEYLWAEPISDSEEAIYLYTNETSEPQLLFTREHENQHINYYRITLSPSQDYVRIQEPHIFRSGLETVSLDFYTVDGEFLHTEVFNNPYPHKNYTYWLGDTITIVLPQDYDNTYEDLMYPLTVIRINEDNTVNATQKDDYLGIYDYGHSPFKIDDNYFFSMIYQDKVQLYDIANDQMIPFTTVSPLEDLCWYVTGRGDLMFLEITQNCMSNPQKIFRAELQVSINAAGE